jgi:Holliday junction DNA helicase RuvB
VPEAGISCAGCCVRADQTESQLRVLAVTFENRPVGIETIAASLAEDIRTVEEFVEPYLLQMGFIQKTPRGRVVAPDGLKHLQGHHVIK